MIALAINGVEPCRLALQPVPAPPRTARAGSTATSVRSALVDPALADRAGALIVVTALFWRSRFKYGARGYRFALLEAGHVIQNAVLVAAALGLQALPVGGFYDRRLDGLVGADGLDEASVYALLLGGPR